MYAEGMILLKYYINNVISYVISEKYLLYDINDIILMI